MSIEAIIVHPYQIAWRGRLNNKENGWCNARGVGRVIFGSLYSQQTVGLISKQQMPPWSLMECHILDLKL